MASYTQSQMLALWRRALGFDTLRTDCSIEVFDGIDLDTVILERMRRWYLGLLDTADPSLLPISEIATSLVPEAAGSIGVSMQLSEIHRRIVAVHAASWNYAVAPSEPDYAAMRLQFSSSPYARPSSGSPLAWVRAGVLSLAPCKLGEALSIRAVVDPGPDMYILDDSLLSTIPTTL